MRPSCQLDKADIFPCRARQQAAQGLQNIMHRTITRLAITLHSEAHQNTIGCARTAIYILTHHSDTFYCVISGKSWIRRHVVKNTKTLPQCLAPAVLWDYMQSIHTYVQTCMNHFTFMDTTKNRWMDSQCSCTVILLQWNYWLQHFRSRSHYWGQDGLLHHGRLPDLCVQGNRIWSTLASPQITVVLFRTRNAIPGVHP